MFMISRVLYSGNLERKCKAHLSKNTISKYVLKYIFHIPKKKIGFYFLPIKNRYSKFI